VTPIPLALLALLLCAPAHAQEDAATFFKGKTLRIVVGSGVGSGYDITARTLARHMGAHIPAIRPSSCRTSPVPAAPS